MFISAQAHGIMKLFSKYYFVSFSHLFLDTWDIEYRYKKLIALFKTAFSDILHYLVTSLSNVILSLLLTKTLSLSSCLFQLLFCLWEYLVWTSICEGNPDRACG